MMPFTDIHELQSSAQDAAGAFSKIQEQVSLPYDFLQGTYCGVSHTYLSKYVSVQQMTHAMPQMEAFQFLILCFFIPQKPPKIKSRK